jgi:type VI secretion system protein ImpF
MEPREQHSNLKTGPKPFRGLAAPLFERLTSTPEDLGAQQEPYRAHALSGALNSIRAEIGRMLNTRVAPGSIFPFPGSASVIHYGLPDFSHLNASSSLDRHALAELLARVIEAFEPRLRRVRVSLEPVAGNRRTLTGRLDALLRLGVMSAAVCFPLDIHTSEGTAAVGQVIDVESLP